MNLFKISNFVFIFFTFGFCFSQETLTRNYIVNSTSQESNIWLDLPFFSDLENDKVVYYVEKRGYFNQNGSGTLAIDTLPQNHIVIYAKNTSNQLLWFSSIYSDHKEDTISKIREININNNVSRIRLVNRDYKVYYFNGEQINSPDNRIITVFFDGNGKRLPLDFRFRSNNMPFDNPLSIKYSNINNNLVFYVVISALGEFSYNDSIISTEDCVKLMQFQIDTIQNKIHLINQRTIATSNTGDLSLSGLSERSLYVNNNNCLSLFLDRLNLSNLYFFTDDNNTKGLEPIIGQKTIVYDENLRNLNVTYFKFSFYSGSAYYYPTLGDNNYVYLPILLDKSEDPNYTHGYYLRIYDDNGELVKEDFHNPGDLKSGRHLSNQFDDKGNYYIFYEYHLDTLDRFHKRYIVKYDNILRKSTFVSPETQRRFRFYKFSQARENKLDFFYAFNSDTLFDFKNKYAFNTEKSRGEAIASIELFPDVTSINEENSKNPKQFIVTTSENGNSVRVSPFENVEYSVSIYTMNGHLLHTLSNVTGEQFIDIEKYTSGMYILKTNTATQTNSFSFIKQR
jgi:hypothetical protein